MCVDDLALMVVIKLLKQDKISSADIVFTSFVPTWIIVYGLDTNSGYRSILAVILAMFIPGNGLIAVNSIPDTCLAIEYEMMFTLISVIEI